MPTLSIEFPKPHNGHIAVVSQKKRFNVLVCGRRWRKTTLCMRLAVEAALAGKSVVWGSPTHDQNRIAWDETWRAAAGVFDFGKTEKIAYAPTGGKIIFRSLDKPDNARGHSADLVIIDEAGDCPEEAWTAVLRPMLIDTQGEAWLIGTPKGRNWFYREYVRGKSDEQCMSWSIPTLGVKIVEGELLRSPHPYENPDIPFEELRQAFTITPEKIFRQEYLAEFVDDAGLVFRGVDAASLVIPREPYPGRFAIGVDWGRSNDFSVFSVMDRMKREQVDLMRFNEVNWSLQLGRLTGLYRKWKGDNNAVILLVEKNSFGDVLCEFAGRPPYSLPVTPFTTTNKSKNMIIEALANDLERRRVKLLNDEVQKNELKAYEEERLPSGVIRYGAPDGVHDDTVIALALANWASRMIPASERQTEFRITSKTATPKKSSFIRDFRKQLWESGVARLSRK